MFPKSAPAMSRTALAKSKKFWTASSSSNQVNSGPGFFVSTPQFNWHQQNQLAIYHEDTRGAGNSSSSSDTHGIDSNYLAITAGATGASGAPGLYYDEESKDDTAGRANLTSKISRHPSIGTGLVSEKSQDSRATPSAIYHGEINVDPIAEAINQTGKVSVIDGMLKKMRRLQVAGSHKEVLATFELLEALKETLPIEAYNMVLATLSRTCDISTLLEAYEKMVCRGILPDDTTYSIVLNALVETAERMASTRAELALLVGTTQGVLESVDEVLESLAEEEYLLLSHSILQAMIATHPRPWSSQLLDSLNRVVHISVLQGLPIPEAFKSFIPQNSITRIDLEDSIQSAARCFSSLSPESQNSAEAHLAMMRSYFKHKEPSGAIAFFSGCGSPNYLLKPLLVGFAKNHLVATAKRWVSKTSADAQTINDILVSIPSDANAVEILPSATALFYKLDMKSPGNTSGGGMPGNGDSPNFHNGHCAYLRIAVAARNTEALYMAIRKSRLDDITWDAVTTTQVIEFLTQIRQPLLASDICAWQIPKLVLACKSKNLNGFVDQEVVSNFVASLQREDQLSVDAALRILPVATRCSGARKCILEKIRETLKYHPDQLDAVRTAETTEKSVNSLSSIVISSSLKATGEELNEISIILPAFVRHAMDSRCSFSVDAIWNIEEALSRCEASEELKKQFSEFHQSALAESKIAEEAPHHLEASLSIQRYALAPRGLDYAISILKSQCSLRHNISSDAISAVMEACLNQGELQFLDELFTMMPKNQDNLNQLIICSSKAGKTELARKCRSTLLSDLGVYPTYQSYSELISSQHESWAAAEELFEEARTQAKLVLGADIYNIFASISADHLKQEKLADVLRHMQTNGYELTASAYESILLMNLSLGEGKRALELLQRHIPMTTKSLLSINCFNEIMSYFIKKSPDRQAALDVFMELRGTGSLATPSTYRLLMEAYLLPSAAEKPNLEKADLVLRLMRKDGVKIPTRCFETLLRARGVQFRDFEGARDFYRGLVTKSRVLPDKGIFKALMESCVSNGKTAEMPLIFQEMKKYHVPVDESISRLAQIY